MSADRRNIPVPDELAQVRAKIKVLEQREAELRALLLANPDIREGASWLAEIKTVTTQRTDIKEMRAIHPEIVEQYTFSVGTTRIDLSAITSDGELIPARRFKNAVQD